VASDKVRLDMIEERMLRDRAEDEVTAGSIVEHSEVESDIENERYREINCGIER